MLSGRPGRAKGAHALVGEHPSDAIPVHHEPADLGGSIRAEQVPFEPHLIVERDVAVVLVTARLGHRRHSVDEVARGIARGCQAQLMLSPGGTALTCRGTALT